MKIDINTIAIPNIFVTNVEGKLVLTNMVNNVSYVLVAVNGGLGIVPIPRDIIDSDAGLQEFIQKADEWVSNNLKYRSNIPGSLIANFWEDVTTTIKYYLGPLVNTLDDNPIFEDSDKFPKEIPTPPKVDYDELFFSIISRSSSSVGVWETFSPTTVIGLTYIYPTKTKRGVRYYHNDEGKLVKSETIYPPGEVGATRTRVVDSLLLVRNWDSIVKTADYLIKAVMTKVDSFYNVVIDNLKEE